MSPKHNEAMASSPDEERALTLRVVIVTRKPALARELEEALEKAFGRELELRMEARVEPPKSFDRTGEAAPWGELVILDGTSSQLPQWISRTTAKADRLGRATIVCLPEEAALPEVYREGLVDGILVSPFRALEIQALLRFVIQAQAWAEVKRVAEETRHTLDQLREDMQLAERIQREHLPVRFPDVKGFKVRSRYFAGERSGGEHLELADSRDASQLLMLMTDSSSYGLSSAVISTIGRVAARIGLESLRSPGESGTILLNEIRHALKPRDQLSFFYGILSRKDFVLRYLSLGICPLFVRRQGGRFEPLASHGKAFASGGLLPLPTDQSEVSLGRSDRLVLLSDGFQRVICGVTPSEAPDPMSVAGWLDKKSQESGDSESLLNELSYSLRSRITEEDALPPEDCTAAVFDVDSKILKLA
jgi:hypothetical protein